MATGPLLTPNSRFISIADCSTIDLKLKVQDRKRITPIIKEFVLEQENDRLAIGNGIPRAVLSVALRQASLPQEECGTTGYS
jgi:hypothetical protein